MSEYPTHLIRRIRHHAFGVEEKAVLMNLADRMRSVSDIVWPSVETIASDCGMSERAARYVIGWLVSVGALVEVQDGRRTRSFRIDFERLERLPEHLPSRSRNLKDRHQVPPILHNVHPDRHAVQELPTGTACTHGGTREQGDRHGVHPRPAPGAPEGLSEGTKKEPEKEQFTARVPRRLSRSSGSTLGLDFGQANPSTATPLPVTPATCHETVRPIGDDMNAGSSAPPVKGNVGAKSKGASKVTKHGADDVAPKQTRATQWPDDFGLTAEMIAYAVNRGMTGPAHVADEFERFENHHKSKGNKFVDWKLAFYNWVRNWEERKNRNAPTRSQSRMSTMQTEADPWVLLDERLLMEHG
jgi:hypothetical protein